MSRIAFIGLGNMGGPMAANLVKNGHSVRVFDLVPAAVQAAVDAGASAAASARDTLADAEVVISMLPASRHVEGVYLGDDGILAAIPAGALVIDCSTIAPASARKVSEAAAARGLQMIDAPVSGGTAGAQAGTLTFIVGGEEDALERARPVLQAMGKNIFHVGASGAGQVAKLCNNMALGVIMAVTGEAIALGVAHGLDPKVLSQMMAVSTGRSWATEVQPVAGRAGECAGLAWLQRRFRQRSDAEGHGPGGGSGDECRRLDSAGRSGPQPVLDEPPGRPRQAGFLQRRAAHHQREVTW
jgi:3-hydroxyisobutyrate dehydrogenase